MFSLKYELEFHLEIPVAMEMSEQRPPYLLVYYVLRLKDPRSSLQCLIFLNKRHNSFVYFHAT